MAAGTLVSSGSSLNMPTGSGSERLRRATIHDNDNAWAEILSGTAGHIYTILSVVFCNNTSSTWGIGMRVNNGSNDIYLLNDGAQKVGGYDTFVFTDKFILEEERTTKIYLTRNFLNYILNII